MSSCQKDVKCQKVKHMHYGWGSQKNWPNEVHIYWCTYEGHQSCSKLLSLETKGFWWPSCDVKIDINMLNFIPSMYFL